MLRGQRVRGQMLRGQRLRAARGADVLVVLLVWLEALLKLPFQVLLGLKAGRAFKAIAELQGLVGTRGFPAHLNLLLPQPFSEVPE